MKTRIRRSHGGKFIVNHRSVHYHQIFANALLRRHVARSGNMHVRNSTKHFLNVRMASYAVPSFSPYTGRGVPSIVSDTSCHSGIVQEMDSGIPLDVYQNLSSLACINQVRLVKDGKFYSMNMLGGDPSIDKEYPFNQYPCGLYYGWFSVRVWTTSHDKSYGKQSGYVFNRYVRGFLIQKKTSKTLCGRIVSLASNNRKRTNNTYSRECTHPAESFVHNEDGTYTYGTYKRCASRSFVPTRPVIYIPFEAYDALPFAQAFIPVNYPNPLKSEMTISSDVTFSYKHNTKVMSSATGGEDIMKGRDGTTNAATLGIADPSSRSFKYNLTSPISISPITRGHNKGWVYLKETIEAIREYFVKNTKKISTFKYTLTVKCLELSKLLEQRKVSLSGLRKLTNNNAIVVTITKNLEVFEKDMEYYRLASSGASLVKRSELFFYSDSRRTTEPVYYNGKQVKSYVESVTKKITLPLRLSLSTQDSYETRYIYNALYKTLSSSQITRVASIAPVSSILLGGRNMFTSMMRNTPVIQSSLTFEMTDSDLDSMIDAYNNNTNGYALSKYVFSPLSLLSLFRFDPVNKCNRILRVGVNDPSGDSSYVNPDMFLVEFTLPFSLSENISTSSDMTFVALINTNGKCIYSDTSSTFIESFTRMEDTFFSALYNDTLKIPASSLKNYNGQIDINGNATVSVRPTIIQNSEESLLTPLSSYMFGYFTKANEEIKKKKREDMATNPALKNSYMDEEATARLNNAVNSGFIPMDNVKKITGVFTFSSGFNPGAFSQKYRFSNAVYDYEIFDGSGKTVKCCNLELVGQKHSWIDSSQNKDKAFTFNHGNEYMTQWMMDSLDPLVSSVLDIHQIPSIILNYKKDGTAAEKADNPKIVNYVDKNFDPEGKIGSIHLHLKYGAFPMYMNIDSPYLT